MVRGGWFARMATTKRDWSDAWFAVVGSPLAAVYHHTTPRRALPASPGELLAAFAPWCRAALPSMPASVSPASSLIDKRMKKSHARRVSDTRDGAQ